MNSINLIGRLTKDVTFRKGEEGKKSAAAFSIAVDNGKDSSGEKQTLFIDCKVFGKTAEVVNNYCKKGDRIALIGKLNQGHYTAKNGNNVTFYEVLVSSIDLLEPKQNEKPEEKVETHNTVEITRNELPF